MWLVAIVLLVGGGSMQAESFSGTGIVFISPATKQVQINETFDLYIAIDAQVKYFKTFEYDIEVDTNVIQLTAAAPEPFFPAGMFVWKDTVKTYPLIGSRYVYQMEAAIFGYETYVDGPGNVVKLTFKAVANGVSDVIFRYVYMADWHENLMSLQDSVSGQVIVCPLTNQPPVANAGRDSTLLQCTPAAISIAAGCTDPNGNLSTCVLAPGSSTGTYNGSNITFTPTGSGTYTFILKATDLCGLTDYDTSVVNVTANQPPVANAGRDSTLSQCTAAAISVAAGCTDPNGNLSTCLLTSSTGTYSGGNITFTPPGIGTYTFILKATDLCGLTDYDTSVVNVTANQPPVANAGRDSTLSQSIPAPISIVAGCTDPDNNLSTCQLTSSIGTYNGSNITFTPPGIGTYTFILKATDLCGATDYDTSVVNVTPSYHCGDSNGDGNVDISDVVHQIAYIFSGGSAPSPYLAGDANCDGTVDISDVVYLISYIFSGGSAPCGLLCIH